MFARDHAVVLEMNNAKNCSREIVIVICSLIVAVTFIEDKTSGELLRINRSCLQAINYL